MNIFVKGFDLNQTGIKIIEKVSKRIGVQNIYSIGNSYAPKEWIDLGIKVIPILDYDNLKQGAFEGVNWNLILPLEPSIINEMAHIERQVLNMLDREEPYYHNHIYFNSDRRKFNVVVDPTKFKINQYDASSLSYHERRDFYLKALRFWNAFLLTTKIECFIFNSIPHDSNEFVLYSLLKQRKYSTLMLSLSPFKNRIFILKDYIDFSFIKDRFKNVRDTEIQSEVIKQEIKRLMMPSSEQEIPWYEKINNEKRKKPKSNLNRLRKIKSLCKLDSLKGLKKFLKLDIDWYQYHLKGLSDNKLFETRLHEFYESNSVKPDYSKRYIYVPLHYQPELTTAPLGGVFANQILMVQLLSFYLPKDVYLFVKEHPQQKYKGRSLNFYLDLVHIKNVILISKSENSFKLLENCTATASITGTAGWEGLFKNKPYLMFGNYVYKEMPGVFSIANANDYKRALDKILTTKIEINKGDLLKFSKAIELETVYGYTQQPPNDMDYDRAINEMAEGLITKVHSLNEKQ